MIQPLLSAGRIRPASGLAGPANTHRHVGRRLQQRRIEDPILHEDPRASRVCPLDTQLARRGLPTHTRTARIKPVPRDHPLLIKTRILPPALIHINHVRQKRPPAIMRHPLGIVEGGIAHRENPQVVLMHGANVVRLAVVVPGDDLHILGRQLEHLLPAVEPEIVPAPGPVLVEHRQVSVEPRRDGHDVRPPVQRRDVLLVQRGVHIVCAGRPRVPAHQAVDDGAAGCRLDAQRGPVGDEEEVGLRVVPDVLPDVGALAALEGRDERLVVVVLVVCAAGGVGVDDVDDLVGGPLGALAHVEGEEHLEVVPVGDGEGVVEDELVVVQAVAEVQGEGVDVRGLRGEDVVGPCFLREVDGVGYLVDISIIQHGQNVIILTMKWANTAFACTCLVAANSQSRVHNSMVLTYAAPPAY